MPVAHQCRHTRNACNRLWYAVNTKNNRIHACTHGCTRQSTYQQVLLLAERVVWSTHAKHWLQIQHEMSSTEDTDCYPNNSRRVPAKEMDCYQHNSRCAHHRWVTGPSFQDHDFLVCQHFCVFCFLVSMMYTVKLERSTLKGVGTSSQRAHFASNHKAKETNVAGHPQPTHVAVPLKH